jgi:hypothetical protein
MTTSANSSKIHPSVCNLRKSCLYYVSTTNVVVRDLKTGVTQIVSIDPDAGGYYYFGSYAPSISATGRFISYTSDSSNLVSGDNNGAYDVFVSRRW